VTAQAEWQQGYDIDYLKGIYQPFKELHKPLVYGAFGLVKERDIAVALTKEQCCFDSKRTTCLIWKWLKRGSTKTDFKGEPFKYEPDSLVITHFVTTDPEIGSQLMGKVMTQFEATGKPVYAEVFEEDITAREIVQFYGFGWQRTKVTAGSEIMGLYRLGHPHGGEDSREAFTLGAADTELLDECQPLTDDELEAVRAELDNCSLYAQHYSSYNKRKSWTSFALRGYSRDDPEFIIKPSEMSKKWKQGNAEMLDNPAEWTNVAEQFPTSVSIAERFGTLDRVRFMKLGAGGELSRHADITDRDAGVRKGKVMRLHIPIYTNNDITFYAWDLRGSLLTMSFEVGNVYYLDQRKPHRVTNNSKEDRVHLVIDVVSSGESRRVA